MMVHFPRRSLESLAASVDYGVTASATSNEVGPQFLRITDIQDDQVNWAEVPYCEARPGQEEAARLEVGDIVFARTGATTGKSFLLRVCPKRAVFASYLIRVRPDRAQVEPRYLSWYFQTPEYWRQITSSASGTAQPGVNATKLRSISVPTPDIPEQRRIADILDKADAIRRKRKKTIALTEELLRSTFLDMFGDPVTNPKGWETAPLGELLSFLTSGSRGWARFYADTGETFLRVQNVRNDAIDLSDVAYVSAPSSAEARRTQTQPGDVLLSITADLGRTGVVPETLAKAFINQHLAILRPQGIESEYLSAYLASDGGQRQIRRLDKGGVKAGLNFDDIRSIQVLSPPSSLQRSFARAKAGIRRLQARQARLSESCDQLFSSLVAQAFLPHASASDAESSAKPDKRSYPPTTHELVSNS